MTFDPQHDYETMESAKARLGGKLQEDCTCPACVAAGVGRGADGKILMRSSRMVDGQKEFIGRWWHGFELKRELLARRALFAELKSSLAGHAMVER